MPYLSPATTPYYGGGQVKFPADTIYVTGAPSTADTAHRLGTLAIDNSAGVIYGLASLSGGTATWSVLSSGGSSDISTLTGDSGGAIGPSGGNITLAGTANQITTTGTTNTITWSIPTTFVAPGTIASTTTLHAGTALSAATTITATLGNITATNGNLVLGTAGNKLSITTGSNASCGVTSAMSGSPGAIAVSTTACTDSSVILYSRATTGGTPGQISITAQSTSGFTLTSTGNESSTFNWVIIN